MIRKFYVKNYKNFKDKLCFDLTDIHDYDFNKDCINNDGIIKNAIIYGRNAEGKSNLGKAILDIKETTLEMHPYRFYPLSHSGSFKNTDTDISECAEFGYSFLLNGNIIDYNYKKKDMLTTVAEELAINSNLIYKYDAEKQISDFSNIEKINANGIDWSNYISTLNSNIKKNYSSVPQPSVLRYICYNTIQPENSVIKQLMDFIGKMSLSGNLFNEAYDADYRSIINNLPDLQKFEKFLNENGINCKLQKQTDINGNPHICFMNKNNSNPIDFFSNMSSGTNMLTFLYLNNFCEYTPSFIFIDEFDAHYHFELSEKIFEVLRKDLNCQAILTTHNTNVLNYRSMRPDCFMILRNGKITSICSATNRELKQGHNLENLYINGEFDE